MTEQEATELIATKLMGYLHEEQDSGGMLWHSWRKPDGTSIPINAFTPFRNSNHARMVKAKLLEKGILKNALCEMYFEKLYHRVIGERWQEGLTAKNAFALHMAPDADCMWAIVDVLKEMVKLEKP